MRNVVLVLAALAVLVSFSGIANAQARDHISIVGSSTVYPFATVVAEQFGKTTDFPTPKIESTGSGGGFKLFCAGVGTEHPDITNASRRIKMSEFEKCQASGVKDIVEVRIGYDGIVFANSKKSDQYNFTPQQIFLALAKQVPAKDGSKKLVDNPYKKWSDIDDSLPNADIEVLGPPPTSGTRDAFSELVLEAGAKSFDWLKAMRKEDKKAFKAVAHTVREDGAYVEAGENDNLIVQKLEANPAAFGIFGFSFLDQNRDKIQGSKIEDVAPTFDAISDGSYPVSRSLQFYVKKAHVGTIPGMEAYLAEFTSEQAWGPDGYLAEKGMIPMSEDEREKYSTAAAKLTPMTADDI